LPFAYECGIQSKLNPLQPKVVNWIDRRRELRIAFMSILLVEDHKDLAYQVARRIEQGGFAVHRLETVGRAIEALQSHSYSIALLDRRLPDGDGLLILAEIKRLQPACRVLMLTALDALDDRIAGLDAGADDYLVKPFDLEELMARIRASVRRAGAEALPPVSVGRLVFDLSLRTASVAGQTAIFHNREMALLESLVRRAGVIVRRETLMSEIWGWEDEVQPHALTLLVGRLRIRLEQLDAAAEIHAARGVGYMIAEKQT
jgi:DNA-binding response OmpR family regulator